MARTYHSEERILEAVRDLFLEHGPRGLTTAAISARSGAPVGSLYHRFRSVPEMVAELWIRTVRDLQADLAAAADRAAPGMPAAMAVVDAVLDFAARRPLDARFFLTAGRRELEEDSALPDAVADTLRGLDGRTDALARRLARDVFGRATPGAVEKVHIGVFGVTFTTLHRVLASGRDPRRVREILRDAARAVLEAGNNA